MRRILSVVFSCMLLAGALLGVDKCPKPPSQPEQCPKIEADGCVTSGFGGGVCTVPLDYFIKYQGCTGQHDPIQIAVGDSLRITDGNGSSIREQFSVGSFTAYKQPSGAGCDHSGTKPTAVEPFYEPFIGSLQKSHNLQAMQEGCYKVNLTLNQQDPDHPGSFCTIDPHIIIRGGRSGAGLLMRIRQLNEEIKELDDTLKEIKKELKRLEDKEKKEEKHHE
jgi:hypothetical protein